jgi:hypothetical protein
VKTTTVTHHELLRLAGPSRAISTSVEFLCDRVADGVGGVAVYTNLDNGSLDKGLHKFLSYGDPNADLPSDPPPDSLPGSIYRLTHIWRPEHG